MSYFNDIKAGDRVWSFEYGMGVAISVRQDLIEVNFAICRANYTFNGVRITANKIKRKPTLFWDEIKFDVPKKTKIELKEEWEYDIKICRTFFSATEVRSNALKQIKRFARLLALRDQECEDSRGYEFTKNEKNYFLVKLDNVYETRTENKHIFTYRPDRVYFKTEKDCEKIADILNSGRFDLDE